MLPHWIHKEFRLDGKMFQTKEELTSFIERNYPEGLNLIHSWLGQVGTVEVSTSGSTGKPKIIQLERSQMMASAKATGAFFKLGPGTSALLCLPLRYIAGKMMLVRAMTLGWNLRGILPEIKLDLQPDMRFDFAAMTPQQMNFSLPVLNQIKILIVGGGPVSLNLKNRIKDISTRVFATYGMTETITHIALRSLNRSAGEGFEQNVYTALPEVVFSKDARGCLVIRCPRISGQDIVTNDVIELISKTSFIWKGRFDFVINSGGIKLFPEEIEHKFSGSIPRRFFAAGVRDEILGDKLIFVVEGERDDSLMSAINRHQTDFSDQIKKIEVPKQLMFISAFVETETKKIDRLMTLRLSK